MVAKSESNEIVIVNGPNLNLLGKREVELYGQKGLEDIIKDLKQKAAAHEKKIVDFQSNHEGEIVDFIQSIIKKKDQPRGIIINPGAFSHTSIAIRDALLATNLPIVEVHITNIFSRESFRKHSYISDIANGVISGLGTYGYQAALFYFL